MLLNAIKTAVCGSHFWYFSLLLLTFMFLTIVQNWQFISTELIIVIVWPCSSFILCLMWNRFTQIQIRIFCFFCLSFSRGPNSPHIQRSLAFMLIRISQAASCLQVLSSLYNLLYWIYNSHFSVCILPLVLPVFVLSLYCPPSGPAVWLLTIPL